ncbi:GNAT family N-acetyltransferase [Ramlibacter sp. WS9]|uniref:GNAT family N-acetyltransferase n=1 Tax=Ramlibacter sp. WS9 TaxID=1882741 RepID=UPI0011425CFD|nr:GNAT family N-acetyltransferase [Ramlibacter sp. WS9]ROZ77077.1 GNAT family N-acetyltransferase [Ramlibacter sp. WS9]
MHRIDVNFGTPELDLAGQWAALSGRSAGNVFMDPIALRVVCSTHFANMHVLLAWLRDAQAPRLVGLWALQDVRVAPLGPAFLATPPYNYAFLSNPVIDPDFMDDAAAAFLDAIDQNPHLPKLLRLRCLDASSDSYAAIVKSLVARNARIVELGERQRAFVTREFGVKRSGSTRKKLRHNWHRLCTLGQVEVVNDRSESAARDAFEVYLAMEAASWKGARGTALLCNVADAAFARQLIAALAAERSASVALLKVNGRAIAAQVLLYGGAMAYTWKTAFDSGYGKFSPGALLVDRLTEQLFATDGIDAIESCSPNGGFMAQIWDGRRATVDLVADLGCGNSSLRFNALANGERVLARLRHVRNTLHAVGEEAMRRRRAWL